MVKPEGSFSVRRSASALAAILALVSCQRPEGGNALNATDENEAAPQLPIPVAEAPLDRGALLLAVIRAASAHATGADDADSQRRLDGKPFEFRIRFGCPNMPNAEQAVAASFDLARRSVALRATPNIRKDDAVVALFGSEAFETVEGFWIDRPWTMDAACPRALEPGDEAIDQPEPAPAADGEASPRTRAASGSSDQVAPEAPRRTVGIAQFFTVADPRTHRRDGRPYSTSKALPSDQAPSGVGYDLVLSGRLRRLPNGRVIACASVAADAPPACVISANFDRVWFERPDTREKIAEWGRS